MSLVTGSAGQQTVQASELDLGALGRYISQRKKWLIIPAALALVASFVAVNLIKPVYRSEARILIESGENPYTRPDSDRNPSSDRSSIDSEAIASQVQLLMSRDVARKAIERLDLGKKSEFDPLVGGRNPVAWVLGQIGLTENLAGMTPEERILRKYFERVSAFQVEKSRLVAVQFESNDPDFAAKGANTLADLYLDAQRMAKQSSTRQASAWLSTEVEGLRAKVEDAEAKVEAFRARANLFVGSNNVSLTAQQLAEVTTQIQTARAQQADAQTRSRLLRDMLKTGRPIEAGDITNSEIIRRLTEQKSSVVAQLAEQSSTLGPRHPRIGELRAQTEDLDRQIRAEGEKLVRSLENDARIAGARVESLNVTLEQVKKTATQANEQEVQLRVLEREAKSLRDQLETLMMRYRDASARDTIAAAPADARIVSKAVISTVPAFPKKLPTMIIATLGAFMLSLGALTAGAFMSGEAVRQVAMPMHSAAPMHAGHMQGAVAPQGYVASPAMDAVGAPLIPGGRSNPFSLDELLQRAQGLGDAGRRIVFASVGRPAQSADAALAFARHLSQHGYRVVCLDLNLDTRRIGAVAGTGLPGIGDLFANLVSFGQIINKDRQSTVHIVSAGNRIMTQRELFSDERLTLAVHALAETYDVVIMDAGRATEMTDHLYEAAGFGVLIAEQTLGDQAVGGRYQAMTSAGYADVAVMLPALQAAA